MVRGFLTRQDPKQFLFVTRTPGGIRAGLAFLARLKGRSQNRDKEITVTGDRDRLAPSVNTRDLAQRLPNSDLIIYPDSGHGAVFQFHTDFVPKAIEFLAREVVGACP